MSQTEQVETEKKWQYIDNSGNIQGPFSSSLMRQWFEQKYVTLDLKVKLWVPDGEKNKKCNDEDDDINAYFSNNDSSDSDNNETTTITTICDPWSTQPIQKKRKVSRKSKKISEKLSGFSSIASYYNNPGYTDFIPQSAFDEYMVVHNLKPSIINDTSGNDSNINSIANGMNGNCQQHTQLQGKSLITIENVENKYFYYFDTFSNVQGPFTFRQISKWINEKCFLNNVVLFKQDEPILANKIEKAQTLYILEQIKHNFVKNENSKGSTNDNKSDKNVKLKENGNENENENSNENGKKNVDKNWYYMDDNGGVRGPYSTDIMKSWIKYDWIPFDTLIKPDSSIDFGKTATNRRQRRQMEQNGQFLPLPQRFREITGVSWSDHLLKLHSTSKQTQQQQQQQQQTNKGSNKRKGDESNTDDNNHVDKQNENGNKQKKSSNSDTRWFYIDFDNGNIQGPFKTKQMKKWYKKGFFPMITKIRKNGNKNDKTGFIAIKDLDYIPEFMPNGQDSTNENLKSSHDDNVNNRNNSSKSSQQHAQHKTQDQVRNESVRARIIAPHIELPSDVNIPSDNNTKEKEKEKEKENQKRNGEKRDLKLGDDIQPRLQETLQAMQLKLKQHVEKQKQNQSKGKNKDKDKDKDKETERKKDETLANTQSVTLTAPTIGRQYLQSSIVEHARLKAQQFSNNVQATQKQLQQQQEDKNVFDENSKWCYLGDNGASIGPFKLSKMISWYKRGYFNDNTKVFMIPNGINAASNYNVNSSDWVEIATTPICKG